MSLAVWQWTAAFLFVTTLPALLLALYTQHLKHENAHRRRAVLRTLGVPDSEHAQRTLVGFFHPYCNAGGGGERVLWTAVALLQRTAPHVGKDEIIAKVKSRFNIVLEPRTLHFVFLSKRALVEDARWPHFTLLGQSVGSMILAWEALTKLIPDVYIDTMGYAFTFPVVRVLGAGRVPVGAYVHYPTISTEMLARVKARRQGYANADSISSSAALSSAKLLYYRIFMYHYASALRRASFLMVNSSWTKNHIDAILAHTDTPLSVLHGLLYVLSPVPLLLSIAQTVYPPCETDELVAFPLEGREKVLLSVAQFRPEKDHAAQLYALFELLKQHPEHRQTVKLVMVGGCRNNEDAARVESLRALAKELEIAANVEFVVNASHGDVLSWLGRASIGLSTMVDEHFGINVVELMAAGVIPVAHASGGPLNDIVVPYKSEPTGYHATTPATFGAALHTVLSLSPEAENSMRERGRAWAVERFSRRGFEQAWEESGWRKWLPSQE
ncbi:glycosyltransferase family 4 protein [Phellopilus nigrolimitatus]|nr:glycosyltransferase family 4 protein [Phellopilus nigrolimitatus]